jgi:hypothetical protein
MQTFQSCDGYAQHVNGKDIPETPHSELQTESTIVHSRLVFKNNLPILLVPCEDFSEFGQHWKMMRLPSFRGIGRREQPAFQSLQIKGLKVWVDPRTETCRSEEIEQDIRIDATVVHFLIVLRISPQKPLIGFKESTSRQAFIPEKDYPTRRLQDSRELNPRSMTVKPVKGLRSCDEIDASVSQCCSLGSSFNTQKIRVSRQKTPSGFPHFLVGLDSEDSITVS